jgi:hypothetical protein
MPTCPAKPVDEGMNYLFGAFLAKRKRGRDQVGPRPSRHGKTVAGKRGVAGIISPCT